LEALQKLLMPWQLTDVVERGAPHVAGPVIRLGDAQSLRTPSAILPAYGLGEERFGPDPSHVDVVRFAVSPLMRLARPPRDDAPWPTYASGFLRSDALIPVWFLERTRVPMLSEIWRIHRDGRQDMLTVFLGAARGWDGARGYQPPKALVGPRATWQGVEYAADLTPEGDEVELVAIGPDVPDGFSSPRPMVSTRRVAVGECSVIDRVITAVWRGVRCRVVDQDESQALLLLVTDDPATVERLGATEVEPAVFEVVAPLAELTETDGHVTELR
jgi:hypothetical protein